MKLKFIFFVFLFFILINNFNFISAQTSNYVILNWVDSSFDETGFFIERALGSGAFVQIGNVSANVIQYTDFNVQQSLNYFYRVYSYNSYGNSNYSNIIEITLSAGATSVSFSGGGGSSTGSSTNSGENSILTGSVIQNTQNDSLTISNNETTNSISNSENGLGTIVGRAIDGDSEALKELSPLAVYVFIALLIGSVFFIVAKKYMH
ncbi:fibronectin type III domain-containing protein [Candidatus Pacearchaeota archaeon]|nr:fibronectin type III domain-containing protein [Candidatus Pacearchaeota archaeon]